MSLMWRTSEPNCHTSQWQSKHATINGLNLKCKFEREQIVSILKIGIWPFRTPRNIANVVICALVLAFVGQTQSFEATSQRSFQSPQAGVTALIDAVKANDEPTLHAIFGPAGSKLLSSGDTVADAQSRATFCNAYDISSKIILNGETQATLVIGKDEWPMPIPLVKYPDGWRFDTVKGKDEILKRRIGRNEFEAIQVCTAIVDAQREYAAWRPNGDSIPVYATRFISHPGKFDGLYWPTKKGEAPSPLGALLAVAADEGYERPGILRRAPYHGYYYRILTSQGKDAPGGEQNYLVNGKMIGGFAVIAYPARYRASGVMSFLVNHDGVIYEKNLGNKTRTIAATTTTFNPVADWKKSGLIK